MEPSNAVSRIKHPPPDPSDTREKLLQAASEVFAAQGFQATTVREICALVDANVAAVNYHFGDKAGLYIEVLRRSIIGDEERPPTGSPEDLLRLFIQRMLGKTCLGEHASLHFRIMAHEMAQPTPALSQVIAEVIGPKFQQLRGILGAILHLAPDHPTTVLCAHSLIGQIMHYANAEPVIAILSPDLRQNPDRLERVAKHISEFTLHALRGLAQGESL